MEVCASTFEEGLFAQAEQALVLHRTDLVEQGYHSGDDAIDSDDEDDWGANMLDKRLADARSRTVTLPDGDIHVCDTECPYAIEDASGDCTCPWTGRVVTRCCAARTDQSTGRSTWSSDPDMQSGVPLGGWGKKRDMMQASRQAFADASTIDDGVMPTCGASAGSAVASAGASASRAGGKRGALCVDEAPPSDEGPKRQRASKRDVETMDVRSSLYAEAERTLLDLLGKRVKSTRTKPAVDPRLLNKEILFGAALKKYLKETLANGRAPSMDDVSNISLAVDRVIAEERSKLTVVTDQPTLRVYEPRFREASTRLAVSLWTGACRTPYLKNAKRGADSFRPFCAGVYYAFKRGLWLNDGTVLVPRVDAFTNAIPPPRKIAADPASKSLHASSHRGLCTLHKCIGSVSLETARELFDDAIRGARAV